MCAPLSVDGAAAMVAAAVRAAVLAKAPRRTVAAVAAAVACALARPAATAATRPPTAAAPAGASSAAGAAPAERDGGPSPEELLAALRSARAAQRRRKRMRRRAVKEAGRTAAQDEGAEGQPQEPDRGGDPAPSLPSASAQARQLMPPGIRWVQSVWSDHTTFTPVGSASQQVASQSPGPARGQDSGPPSAAATGLHQQHGGLGHRRGGPY
mmetsp:Transcript_146769/g.471168  ORF Transcript_146769/g.471168 Transcript_146769/m.471168 type:complete len:211 (-) Transcript_146769:196-828(-)